MTHADRRRAAAHRGAAERAAGPSMRRRRHVGMGPRRRCRGTALATCRPHGAAAGRRGRVRRRPRPRPATGRRRRGRRVATSDGSVPPIAAARRAPVAGRRPAPGRPPRRRRPGRVVARRLALGRRARAAGRAGRRRRRHGVGVAARPLVRAGLDPRHAGRRAGRRPTPPPTTLVSPGHGYRRRWRASAVLRQVVPALEPWAAALGPRRVVARRAPIVLRRRRAGHRGRGAGPRALRRPRLRPPPDRPQHPRGRRTRRAGRDLRRGAGRGARRRRRSCSPPTASRPRCGPRPTGAACSRSTPPARWSPRCTARPGASATTATTSC